MLTSFIPHTKPDILVVILQSITIFMICVCGCIMPEEQIYSKNFLERLKAEIKTHLKNKVFLTHCIVCLFKYKRFQNITDVAQNFTFAKVYTNLE